MSVTRFDDPLSDAVRMAHKSKRKFRLAGRRRAFRLTVAFETKSAAQEFAERVRAEDGRKPCKTGGHARVVPVLNGGAWAVYKRCTK